MWRASVAVGVLTYGVVAMLGCGDEITEFQNGAGGMGGTFEFENECIAPQVPYHATGACGRNGSMQQCIDTMCASDPNDPPACGCDGKLYDNFCDAAEAFVDLDDAGSCTIPDNRFQCGPLQCFRGTQYCVDDRLFSFDDRSIYRCMNVPAACAPAACSCLELESPDAECSVVEGELRVLIE